MVLALTEVDAECLAPLVVPPAELRRLPPFLDPAPYRAARAERQQHRARARRRFGLDPQQPWLLAVAMMRDDAKRESYGLLADALGQLRALPWQLLVVGDGPARPAVEAMLRGLGEHRVALRRPAAGGGLPRVYAAADLYVWPAVREAYGIALLEAQAAGLPVVAGREGGVAEVVADGHSGVLTPPRDPSAFASAVAALLADAERRRAMAEAAARFVSEQRSITQAAAELAAALAAAEAIRAGADDPDPAGAPRPVRMERERPDPGPCRSRPVGARPAPWRRWRLPAAWAQARLLSSPLRRARETAALLTGRAPTIDHRLIEMDWGAFRAGASPSCARRRLRQWRRARPAAWISGRRGGESPREVCARLHPLLAELAADPAPVVAVCHKGVIRAALVLATGWDMASKPPLRLARAVGCALRCHADGRIELGAPVPLAGKSR